MLSSGKLPPVTRAILYANIAVHLYVMLFLMTASSPYPLKEFYETFGLIPSRFWEGAVWQPLTSMFLHGVGGSMTFMHITFNMIGVVSIGVFLEEAIGSLRFAILYFFSGLTGGLAVILLSPELLAPTVGASGALSGLLAAVALLMPSARVLFLFFIPMKIRTLAVGLFLVSLYFGLQDDGGAISHWGHLGGLVGGFFYTWLSGSKAAMQARTARPSPLDPLDSLADEMQNTIETMLRKEPPFAGPHGQGDYGPYSPYEKEVNPPPPQHEEEQGPADGKPKKIIFDPTTGRYIIK